MGFCDFLFLFFCQGGKKPSNDEAETFGFGIDDEAPALPGWYLWFATLEAFYFDTHIKCHAEMQAPEQPDDGEEWEEVDVDEFGLNFNPWFSLPRLMRCFWTFYITGNPIESTARPVPKK